MQLFFLNRKLRKQQNDKYGGNSPSPQNAVKKGFSFQEANPSSIELCMENAAA